MKEPDFETETIRGWLGEVEGVDSTDGIEIDMGDDKIIKLLDFDEVRNEKGNLVFASKYKAGCNILYYKPKNLDDKDSENVDRIIEGLKLVFKDKVEVKNILDFVEENQHNLRAMERMSKLKETEENA